MSIALILTLSNKWVNCAQALSERSWRLSVAFLCQSVSVVLAELCLSEENEKFQSAALSPTAAVVLATSSSLIAIFLSVCVCVSLIAVSTFVQ